jgi:hypothetical protein
MRATRGSSIRGSERRSPSDPGVYRRRRRQTVLPRAPGRKPGVAGRRIARRAQRRTKRGQLHRSLPAHPQSRRCRRYRIRRRCDRPFRHRPRRHHDRLLARLESSLASCLPLPRPGRRSSHDGAPVFASRSFCHPGVVPDRSADPVAPIAVVRGYGTGSMSVTRIDLPGQARTCRCGRGAIPYVDDGLISCAKCGRAPEPATADTQTRASVGVEERTGCPPPGPSPEPATRPNGRDRARPLDAEPPPAPSLAPQAGSGPSFDWPFGPGAPTGPGRSGGSA